MFEDACLFRQGGMLKRLKSPYGYLTPSPQKCLFSTTVQSKFDSSQHISIHLSHASHKRNPAHLLAQTITNTSPPRKLRSYSFSRVLKKFLCDIGPGSIFVSGHFHARTQFATSIEGADFAGYKAAEMRKHVFQNRRPADKTFL